MKRSEDPCRDPASEMRDDHFKPDALDALRPTPETDARRERNGNVLCGEANLDLCARLERERDLAREQRDKLKARLAHLRNRNWFYRQHDSP